MCCILLCSCVMTLLIMFNWQSFHGNGKELVKVPLVAMGGHAHPTCSLTPSDFVFFAEREFLQHFSHPVLATIPLLVEVWATPFGYLLYLLCCPCIYAFIYLHFQTVVSLVSCLISNLHLGPDQLHNTSC